MLTPDQQGKQMQLRSFNDYFGVTSRNYFNRFRFFIGKAHHAIFSSGFYVTAGYLPFHKNWYYGYWKDDGTSGDGTPGYTFEGGKVYGVPNINNFFIDTGLFAGIGF
ncbi:MAG TPA: hypothetical protein VG367_06630 [Mucilaginibacter sp.]|jgi:hypothetical protein|nr:hypothetical protein [Mucilaginibacter sp.]